MTVSGSYKKLFNCLYYIHIGAVWWCFNMDVHALFDYTVRKNVQNLYLQGYNGLSLGQYPQGYTRCTLSHGYVSVPLQYVPFKGKYVPLLTKLYLIVLWYHNVPLKKVQICPFKGTAPVTSLLYLWMANLYSIQHIKKARMLFITFIKHSKPLHSHIFHRMNVLSSITLS